MINSSWLFPLIFFSFSQAFPYILQYFISIIKVSNLAYNAKNHQHRFFFLSLSLPLSFFLLGMVAVTIPTKFCHRHWALCLWESETILRVTEKLCVPGKLTISSVPVPLLFFPLWILLMVSRSLFWHLTVLFAVTTRKHHQNGEVKESSNPFGSVQLDYERERLAKTSNKCEVYLYLDCD